MSLKGLDFTTNKLVFLNLNHGEMVPIYAILRNSMAPDQLVPIIEQLSIFLQ